MIWKLHRRFLMELNAHHEILCILEAFKRISHILSDFELCKILCWMQFYCNFQFLQRQNELLMKVKWFKIEKFMISQGNGVQQLLLTVFSDNKDTVGFTRAHKNARGRRGTRILGRIYTYEEKEGQRPQISLPHSSGTGFPHVY